MIPLALALGGVGYPSILLALRGRVALGGLPGAACIGDAAASGALLGAIKTSATTIDETTTSDATIGVEVPEC